MLMRVPEATCPGDTTGDRFGSSKLQIINHKALETLAMARNRRPYTKLTCLPFSYHYHRSKGTSLPRWRRGAVHRERPIVRSQTGKAQVVPLLSILLHPHLHHVAPERNDKPTVSLRKDDNGTPATWTLGLVFQQAIDRQDRTQVEGRFNYWNYTGDITTAWYTGILHRTRTRCTTTTCLVGTPSIEATPPAAGTTTSRKAARTTPRRRLRIDPSHHTPVIKTTGHSGLPTTDINH